MKQHNNQIAPANSTGLLVTRVLTGWLIGLAVILFFILGADDTHPDWGQYWMIRPLIITPLAGAAAGMAFHFMAPYRQNAGMVKIAAWVASVLVYFVGLWLGIVIGLNGTMWN